MLDDFDGKLGVFSRRFFRVDALHARRDIVGVEGAAGGYSLQQLGDDRRRNRLLFRTSITIRIAGAGYDKIFRAFLRS